MEVGVMFMKVLALFLFVQANELFVHGTHSATLGDIYEPNKRSYTLINENRESELHLQLLQLSNAAS